MVRQNTARVSALIGDIYDAALSPSCWRGVLKNIANFIGGPSAALYAKDAASKSGNVFYDDGGIDPHYVRLYFDKYIKLDPSTTAHFFAELEKPIATADLIPYAEFLETRFYKEWARPQGLVDHVTAALDKSATGVAMFGVFRHERDGIVVDETRQRMRLIAPHVRRAVLIGRTIDLKVAQAETFADALDALSAAMLLVDARGYIVHANASAHVLLGEGRVLHVVDGKLAAVDSNAEQALHEVFLAADGGDTVVGSKGIAVPLMTRGGERYVAHVLPLTSGARRRAGVTYSAVAALFVHRAVLHVPSPPEVIAKTYGLTPSELRVLLAVVELGGAPEVAEALGVAETTVRFHLRRLFEKTGTHRQADLVKLVAGFSSPLAG
jgi:DNA-binding CsgD family transcriptional regulator/PAS domain-containing protein